MNEKSHNQMNFLSFWFVCHIRAFFYGLGELIRKPIASLMTLFVIAIAIALPAGLFVLLTDAQTLSKTFSSSPTISLYLRKDLASPQIELLNAEIKQIPGIEKTDYISPQQALSDFQQQTQITNIMQLLKQNPLPGVLVITPTKAFQSPARMQLLAAQLKMIPEVTRMQFDLIWIKRLYSILNIGKRLILLLAILFGIGVLLIIGNTIRLTTQNNQQEINILKLFGATSAFVRRPLLYRGFFYGLFSGLLAIGLVASMFWYLKTPILSLTQTYQINLNFSGLTLIQSAIILGSSSLLGLIGSWIAVQKHLLSEETS